MTMTDPEAVAALVERIKEHGIYQSDPIFMDAAALIEALVGERDTLVVESYDMTAFYWKCLRCRILALIEGENDE